MLTNSKLWLFYRLPAPNQPGRSLGCCLYRTTEWCDGVGTARAPVWASSAVPRVVTAREDLLGGGAEARYRVSGEGVELGITKWQVGLSGRRILGFVQPISARLRAEEILHRFPCVNCLTSSLPIAGSRRGMLYYRLQADIRRNGCNLFQRPPVFPATGQNGSSQLIPPATYLLSSCSTNTILLNKIIKYVLFKFLLFCMLPAPNHPGLP